MILDNLVVSRVPGPEVSVSQIGGASLCIYAPFMWIDNHNFEQIFLGQLNVRLHGLVSYAGF